MRLNWIIGHGNYVFEVYCTRTFFDETCSAIRTLDKKNCTFYNPGCMNQCICGLLLYSLDSKNK